MSKCSKTCKVTSTKAASAASKVLRDGRFSSTSKTAAGSALSQKPSKKNNILKEKGLMFFKPLFLYLLFQNGT